MGSWPNGRSARRGPSWGWSGSWRSVCAFRVLTLPTQHQLRITMGRSFQTRTQRADLIIKLDSPIDWSAGAVSHSPPPLLKTGAVHEGSNWHVLCSHLTLPCWSSQISQKLNRLFSLILPLPGWLHDCPQGPTAFIQNTWRMSWLFIAVLAHHISKNNTTPFQHA